MRVLGLDTSSLHASAAIVENERLLVEKTHLPRFIGSPGAVLTKSSHAEILLPLIDVALHEAALSLEDLDGFAVAVGPGSFTGLRIGLSTVKGLTYGQSVRIVGVSTLQACAARHTGANGLICAVLDAQKEEVYAAIFHARHGSIERLSDDGVMSLEELVDRVRAQSPGEPIVLTGDGVVRHGARLVASLGTLRLTLQNENLPTIAAAVALLGESYIKNNETVSPASLAPRYLRRPQAEVNGQKLI